MILILYTNADKATVNFISYLSKTKSDYIALEINEDILKPGIKIIDSGQKCSWIINGKKIDFEKVSSIFNRLSHINYSNFLNYQEEDREYVLREWWSYLNYRLEVSKKSINPPSCELISGVIMNFPYFYSIAKKIGFKIPEYFLSSSYNELKTRFNSGKKYIALNKLFLNNNFIPAAEVTDKTIAIIEHIKGKIVLSHIVQDNIYTCFIEGKEKIDIKLDGKTLQLCHEFRETLKLKVMQIIFIKTDNELFLMNVSAFPNWDYNSITNKQKIYQDLIKILS